MEGKFGHCLRTNVGRHEMQSQIVESAQVLGATQALCEQAVNIRIYMLRSCCFASPLAPKDATPNCSITLSIE